MHFFNKRFFNWSRLFFIFFALSIAASLVYLINCTYPYKGNKVLINFPKDVIGLEIGSSIFFNGINIGYVKKIDLDYNDETIDVIVVLNRKFNIKNKIAQLENRGIAGHKYISLIKSTDDVKLKHKFGYVQIQSQNSKMSDMLDNANKIALDSSEFMKKLRNLDVNKLNVLINNMNEVMKKVDAMSSKLIVASDSINSILFIINSSLKDGKHNLNDLFYIYLPKLNSSIDHMNETLKVASQVMKNFKEKPVRFLLDWYS
ncbi:MAG: MCE family protein [Alphaproteobacteria bacterium]|nr:MAG: MCE family protein [Alphaproteobacteria bacterium]